nr:ribonuclease H-like domain-containing protein [Tanacetum cinerariifolium]
MHKNHRKRVADETLLQESFKKLRAAEVSGSESTQEIPSNDPKAIEDLVALWNLVQEKVSSAVPSKDKEKALWVELKRLFEPDEDDILWKLQRYMYAPLTWKLYTEDNEKAKDLVMKIFMEANKPKSRIDGVVQTVAPTTSEQRLAKKNELKARGTLLVELPDKHQLKFNIHKDAKLQKLISQLEILGETISQEDINLKFLRSLPLEWKTHTLIWRNKANLEEQSLDNLFNNLKIYEAKVKGSSPFSQNTQNRAFMSLNNTDSTNESVDAAPSISAASSKATVSILSNVDSLSDAVIYSFFAKLHIHESDNSVPKNPENDRYKTCEGYHVVSPLYTGTFLPPKPDLVFNDDPKASESVANVFNVESSTNKPSKDMSKKLRPDAPIVEDWISNSEDETEIESKVEPSKQAENLRTNNQKSRGNKKNWNKKACFVCRSLNHLTKDCDYYEKQMVHKPVWNNAIRVNHQNSVRMTDPHSNRNVVPTAVLTRSRLVSLNAARPVPTVVSQSTVKSPRPVKHVINKERSPIRMAINHRPATKNSNFNKNVTTFKVNKVNDVQGNKRNAEKASAYWVWIPKCNVLDHVFILTSASMTLKTFSYTDALGRSNGCSRHMTGNISFLLDFKEIDEGYVSFGGNPKGGKISGKGKIKTGKLDFNNVYFVKELKFNLFSVSQMCDKKNNVLFIDTECVVLSFDFRLPDENHVLLRVPREKNMYNVDLKNVVPSGDLTYLLAKATLDDKAFRVFNSRTRIVQETLHINFLENKPNVAGIGPKWLFDINTLTMSMNYQPVVVGNQPNDNAGIKENLDTGKVGKETVSAQQYVLLPLWSTSLQNLQNIDDDVVDAAFDVKENENDAHVSTNGSNKSTNKKHDEKAKRDDKGKSLVDSLTNYKRGIRRVVPRNYDPKGEECSSYGALYTKSCACPKGGFIDKFARDPNKTPDSSQRPPQDCSKYGNPVDGQYCRHCALLRKKLKEVWFTICDEHKLFQDFLNTSESSNDNSNVVYMPQEPIVFNQDPGENSSQSPTYIDHHCCYGCGDSLDGIFCQQCTCKSCGKGAHYGYNCPSKVPFIYNREPCHNQNVEEFLQTFPSFHPSCYSGDEKSFAYGSTPDFVNDSSNKIPLCYDDDDDEESSTPLRDIIISKLPSCIAITPVLSTKEPKDSLIMGDGHLDTIPEKESDEFIKSSVENLVSNLSESEDERHSKGNLFEPTFDEEIISIKIDSRHFNAESDLIESLLNQDSLIISSSKIDSLLDEFVGELIFLKAIPPGIDEADCDPEEEIRLIEKLLYDNSSPHPPEESNSENSDAVIKYFSPSPIPVEDSDSLMEEIDLSLTPNDSTSSGIENDDYDSEGDILIFEEFLSNDSLSLPENKSFHFDIPSSPRPPVKPPDDDKIKPNSGILTVKVAGDISEHYVLMPRLFPTQPTLTSNQKKSPHLLSYRGLKAFQLSSKSPMMIYGRNIPILDVPFLHFYPP